MPTPESNLEALTKRVAKLESQNRRLKKAGTALLIVSSAMVAMGQAQAKKIIVANEFVLQDASGKTRARLSMELKDKPALTFFRDQTTPTASLDGGDEPYLVLSRPGTAEQVHVGANKEFFGLAIYDKEIRAGLSIQNGEPALDLFNKNGKPLVSLNTSSYGPGLTMNDPANKSLLTLGISPMDEGPNFVMKDSAGTPSVVLLTSEGQPTLRLEDKDGFSANFGRAYLVSPRTGRKESTSAASVVLFGRDNKVLWSAP